MQQRVQGDRYDQDETFSGSGKLSASRHGLSIEEVVLDRLSPYPVAKGGRSMLNPGLMNLMVESKRRDLLADGAHAGALNHPMSLSRVRDRSLSRGRRVLLARARKLVRFAETLGCDREELAQVISCLS